MDCVLHWHNAVHKWTEHHPTRRWWPCPCNVWQNTSNNLPEEALIVGNATWIVQYSTLSNSKNGKPVYSKTRQKFAFFNKNSTSVLKIHANMRPQSISFDVDVETVPAKFLVQVIRGIQCDTNLRNTYRHAHLLHVYKLCVRADKFTVNDKPSEARTFVKNSCQNWKWSRVNLEIDSTTKDCETTSELLLHASLHPNIEILMAKLLIDVLPLSL